MLPLLVKTNSFSMRFGQGDTFTSTATVSVKAVTSHEHEAEKIPLRHSPPSDLPIKTSVLEILIWWTTAQSDSSLCAKIIITFSEYLTSSVCTAFR